MSASKPAAVWTPEHPNAVQLIACGRAEYLTPEDARELADELRRIAAKIRPVSRKLPADERPRCSERGCGAPAAWTRRGNKPLSDRCWQHMPKRARGGEGGP